MGDVTVDTFRGVDGSTGYLTGWVDVGRSFQRRSFKESLIQSFVERMLVLSVSNWYKVGTYDEGHAFHADLFATSLDLIGLDPRGVEWYHVSDGGGGGRGCGWSKMWCTLLLLGPSIATPAFTWGHCLLPDLWCVHHIAQCRCLRDEPGEPEQGSCTAAHADHWGSKIVGTMMNYVGFMFFTGRNRFVECSDLSICHLFFTKEDL